MKIFYWSKKYIDKEVNISNWTFDISESTVVANKAFSWDTFVFFLLQRNLKIEIQKPDNTTIYYFSLLVGPGMLPSKRMLPS